MSQPSSSSVWKTQEVEPGHLMKAVQRRAHCIHVSSYSVETMRNTYKGLPKTRLAGLEVSPGPCDTPVDDDAVKRALSRARVLSVMGSRSTPLPFERFAWRSWGFAFFERRFEEPEESKVSAALRMLEVSKMVEAMRPAWMEWSVEMRVEVVSLC